MKMSVFSLPKNLTEPNRRKILKTEKLVSAFRLFFKLNCQFLRFSLFHVTRQSMYFSCIVCTWSGDKPLLATGTVN